MLILSESFSANERHVLLTQRELSAENKKAPILDQSLRLEHPEAPVLLIIHPENSLWATA